jgi:hypothetical protein
MRKLLLNSILVALVVIPALAARDANAVRGLKRAVAGCFLFGVFYAVALWLLYPTLE